MEFKNLHLHYQPKRVGNIIYPYWSLAESYRRNGKNRKKILLRLGRISREDAARFQALLSAIKLPHSVITTLDDIFVERHYDYLNCAVVSSIWDRWELSSAFIDSNKKEIQTSIVAKALTISQCLEPSSKSYVPEWLKTTACHWILGFPQDAMNGSRIFRELTEIERTKSRIVQHLFKRIKTKRADEPTNIVFYDLTTSTMHGTRCPLAKWGRAKEGYNIHVILALATTAEGYPFYWEVLEGNTAEVKTISWLIEEFKEKFDIANICLVFDRGMVSDDNLKLIEKEKIKYITAVDKSQIESLSGIDFMAFSHITVDNVFEEAAKLSGFEQLQANLCFREVGIRQGRRYILCLNPQLFKDHRKCRQKKIEEYIEFVEGMNQTLADAKKSRNMISTRRKFLQDMERNDLSDFLKVTLKGRIIERISAKGKTRKVRTYSGSVEIDSRALARTGRLDGFWMVVTSYTEKLCESEKFRLPASGCILPYREKNVIEEAFRNIKSFVEIEPIYVWTPTHVRAHYTICVLSYLMNRIIVKELAKGPLAEEFKSASSIHEALNDCKVDEIFVKNLGLSKHSLTRPKQTQLNILSALGLKHLVDNSHLTHIGIR